MMMPGGPVGSIITLWSIVTRGPIAPSTINRSCTETVAPHGGFVSGSTDSVQLLRVDLQVPSTGSLSSSRSTRSAPPGERSGPQSPGTLPPVRFNVNEYHRMVIQMNAYQVEDLAAQVFEPVALTSHVAPLGPWPGRRQKSSCSTLERTNPSQTG